MNISTFVFSPTNTTATVVQAILSQFPKSEITETDWTQSQNCKIPTKTDLVLLGVPVYSGLAPATVIERIKNLKGNQTPIVLISVFGNRGADTATRELYEITSKNGFIPIAAAEFIGEHSFSTPTHPIADGRPDSKDLQMAKAFGSKIKASLETELIALNSSNFDQAPHRERNPMKLDPPFKDLEKCTHCGKCEPVCPQNIWPIGNSNKIDECIGCCACIKVCEDDALSQQEIINNYSVKLNQMCQDRKEPKLILPSQI